MQKKFCRGLLSLALTGIALLAYAQNPLKIGDALPKQFWETPLQMVNTPQKTTTLSADKDKLILLDFWNTWCSACILNFPKMEELQKQFGDKVKILAVSNQDRATLEKFFASKNGSKYNQVQSVAADKMMHNLFPHLGVPFIIWIKDGKLLSTTDAEQVNRESISAVLQGGKNNLQTIVQVSRDRPLMLSEDFDNQKNVDLLNYAFMTKGYLPQIGSGGTFRKTKAGKTYGYQMTNVPLKDILFSVGYHLFADKKDPNEFNEKRMVFEVADPSKILGLSQPDGTYERNLMYSYEFIVPQDKPETLYPAMLDNLSHFTDYDISIENRRTKCLVLQRIPGPDRLKTTGGEFNNTFPQSPAVLQNSPLQGMVNMINGNTPIRLLMLDETGYTDHVDLSISGVQTAEQLSKELEKYGLRVIRDYRNVELLVVRDKKMLSSTKNSNP